MLSTLDLNYIQHLERGYCENHPDVVAGTKQQVVDRAVKQLLTALQGNGFELDGNILKRGNGWLQYDSGTSKWQYSNDAGSTWADIGSGGGGGVTDHTLLSNIGNNTHAQIDSHIANSSIHGGGGPTVVNASSPPTLTAAMYDGRLIVCNFNDTLDLPTPNTAGQAIRIAHTYSGTLLIAHHIQVGGDINSADDVSYGGEAHLTLAGEGSIYLVYNGVSSWISCHSKGTWSGSQVP